MIMYIIKLIFDLEEKNEHIIPIKCNIFDNPIYILYFAYVSNGFENYKVFMEPSWTDNDSHLFSYISKNDIIYIHKKEDHCDFVRE